MDNSGGLCTSMVWYDNNAVKIKHPEKSINNKFWAHTSGQTHNHSHKFLFSSGMELLLTLNSSFDRCQMNDFELMGCKIWPKRLVSKCTQFKPTERLPLGICKYPAVSYYCVQPI